MASVVQVNDRRNNMYVKCSKGVQLLPHTITEVTEIEWPTVDDEHEYILVTSKDIASWGLMVVSTDGLGPSTYSILIYNTAGTIVTLNPGDVLAKVIPVHKKQEEQENADVQLQV